MTLLSNKKNYTTSVVNTHGNDLKKDWYVFFQFKHERKTYKFKKRGGVNRIKELEERIEAINSLKNEIDFNLYCGWNPVADPKCLREYNPYATPKPDSAYVLKKRKLYEEACWMFYNKH